jgi:rhodanese-related sulfurtransferase
MGDFFITVDELKERIGAAEAPIVYDVRRREAFDAAPRILPAAHWRRHTSAGDWAETLPSAAQIVCYCTHGHNVSQLAVAELRAKGLDARTLSGGIEAWEKASGPTILKAALPGRDEDRPSRWVTRIRPKIDRLACPWLIRRFIDREAEFLFVEPAYVADVASELGAIAYDIDGVELSHVGPTCTFDTLIDRFGLTDPALEYLRLVVRGADTACLDLAPEAAGLLAVSLGISAASGGDDRAAVERGMGIYDALYAWRRKAATETHNWPKTRAA